MLRIFSLINNGNIYRLSGLNRFSRILHCGTSARSIDIINHMQLFSRIFNGKNSFLFFFPIKHTQVHRQSLYLHLCLRTFFIWKRSATGNYIQKLPHLRYGIPLVCNQPLYGLNKNPVLDNNGSRLRHGNN